MAEDTSTKAAVVSNVPLLSGDKLTYKGHIYDLTGHQAPDGKIVDKGPITELRYWQDTRNGRQTQMCWLTAGNENLWQLPALNMTEVQMLESVLHPYFVEKGVAP